MTDLDVATARREVVDALEGAFERRHEVLDVIVDAETRDDAVDAIGKLLTTSELGAQAVIGMSLAQLTKSGRRRNAAELQDLNSQLTFTLLDRPASAGKSLTLREFSPIDDRELFEARTAELGLAGDGSGAPAASISEELDKALQRVEDEEAVWLVAEADGSKVGIVFGELVNGEIDVRVWIRPEQRKRGYAVASLRKSRSEMAANFPGVHMVVRAPSA